MRHVGTQTRYGPEWWNQAIALNDKAKAKDSLKNDTIKKPKNALEDIVKYKAKDSIDEFIQSTYKQTKVYKDLRANGIREDEPDEFVYTPANNCEPT